MGLVIRVEECSDSLCSSTLPYFLATDYGTPHKFFTSTAGSAWPLHREFHPFNSARVSSPPPQKNIYLSGHFVIQGKKTTRVFCTILNGKHQTNERIKRGGIFPRLVPPGNSRRLPLLPRTSQDSSFNLLHFRRSLQNVGCLFLATQVRGSVTYLSVT